MVYGPDAGIEGIISTVNKDDREVTIPGLNIQKGKNRMPDGTMRETSISGGIPMDWVKHLDPASGKPTNVYLKDGMRYSASSESMIPISTETENSRAYRENGTGAWDTSRDVVEQRTFVITDPWQPPFPRDLTLSK